MDSPVAESMVVLVRKSGEGGRDGMDEVRLARMGVGGRAMVIDGPERSLSRGLSIVAMAGGAATANWYR